MTSTVPITRSIVSPDFRLNQPKKKSRKLTTILKKEVLPLGVFKSGFLRVTIPIKMIGRSGYGLAIFTPLENEMVFEPPHKEIITFSAPGGEFVKQGIDPGKEYSLFCTGLYFDIEEFKLRSSIYLIVETPVDEQEILG